MAQGKHRRNANMNWKKQVNTKQNGDPNITQTRTDL